MIVLGVLGALAIYFRLPGPAWQEVAYDTWTTLAAVLVVAGVRINRPADSLPWLTLAAGLGLMALGDWTWTLLAAWGQEPFPSVADAFYLSGMALVGLAVWAEGRGRVPGGNRPALIDALILACGFALLSWWLVMKPIAADGSAAPLELAFALAYPSIDIALLAVTARLVLASGLRAPTYRLLAVALTSYLVADLAFAWIDLNEGYSSGHLVNAGWLIGVTAFALATLHPSMARVDALAAGTSGALTLRRVAALAAASLMAPLLLLVQAWQGEPIDALVIAGASIALFLLVIGRLVTVLVDLRRAFVQREVLEAELRRQATEDPLTGLANRALFTSRLLDALRRPGEQLALLFIDLDDFKRINDTLGHPAGDAVLREVAARIRPLVRPGDTAARLGGDEFAVLLPGVIDAAVAQQIASRLLEAVAAPVRVGEADLLLGASAGVAVGEAGIATPESLMRNADIAMYRAKAAGKGDVRVYDGEGGAQDVPPLRRSGRAARAYHAAST